MRAGPEACRPPRCLNDSPGNRPMNTSLTGGCRSAPGSPAGRARCDKGRFHDLISCSCHGRMPASRRAAASIPPFRFLGLPAGATPCRIEANVHTGPCAGPRFGAITRRRRSLVKPLWPAADNTPQVPAGGQLAVAIAAAQSLVTTGGSDSTAAAAGKFPLARSLGSAFIVARSNEH